MARWDQSYSAPKTTPSEGALVIHLPHRRLYKFVVCFFFFNENDTRFVCLESDSLPGIPGGSASHQWLRSITWNYTTTTNWVIRSKTSRIMVWRWGKSSSQQNKYLAGENCFKKKSLKEYIKWRHLFKTIYSVWKLRLESETQFSLLLVLLCSVLWEPYSRWVRPRRQFAPCIQNVNLLF